MTRLPLIAITMGDPAGIGPELIVAALDPQHGVSSFCLPIVIGDAQRLQRAAQLIGLPPRFSVISAPAVAPQLGAIGCIDLANVSPTLPFGHIAATAGQAAYEYVCRAVELALAGEVDAICTLPLNKEALWAAGHRYPGHTELLAALTGTTEVSMMLETERFRVVHVTAHMGLIEAIAVIEPGLVQRTILRTDEALRRAGIERPAICICGINPHAGENGLFGGGEEEAKIEPAIELARQAGIDVQGPLPADTAFFRAQRGDFDAVVAMYHDQGHAPVKVLGLDKGVNITIGLPVVRTSVDHGTAFDIAGTGAGDIGSLLQALRAAARLAPRRRSQQSSSQPPLAE